MQLPEPADRVLRPDLQGRRSAGMQKGGTAGDDLDRVGDAERREERHRVALGVEGVDAPAAAPVSSLAARLRASPPQPSRGDALVVFARTEEDLPDLEQGD